MYHDDGENWMKFNSPSVGQFYDINVDMKEPYNVYGGFQDNGVWMGHLIVGRFKMAQYRKISMEIDLWWRRYAN